MIQDRKYVLTDETIVEFGRTLYRIKAVLDFGDVHAGDLGGFVESKDNLSPIGDAWIYDNAKVMDKAHIYGC